MLPNQREPNSIKNMVRFGFKKKSEADPGWVRVLVKLSPNLTQLTVKLPKHPHIYIYIYIVINPKMKWVISAHTLTDALLILAHSPLPLSLTRNLIVGPSCHCRSKLYHSLAQALSLLVCSILFKIIYIYIYIYIVFSLRCLFHMNPICRVKVRGITWHHCQVPKPSPICRAKVCFLFIFFFQNSSISILLIHTIFVPKPSPYIH